MPMLLHKMGLGEFAKSSCRSPFREDKRASWGIFQRDGNWFFKDQATGERGDEIALLAVWKGFDTKRDFKTILKIYAQLAGIPVSDDSQAQQAEDNGPSFAWSQCVAAFTEEQQGQLGQWRGYSPEFCVWLRKENLMGLYDGKWATPVHGQGGAAIGCHYRVERDGEERPIWFYHPKGRTVRPLIIGDCASARSIWVFEGQWDAFAVMDRLGWHLRPPPNIAVFITRSASNGKLVRGCFDPRTVLYAFKQNDQTKNGKNPAEEWLADVCANAACKVFNVATPANFKDVNDWTRGGATRADIEASIEVAKPIHEPPRLSTECKAGENVENAEVRVGTPLTEESFSTFSTGGNTLALAIYPEGSWLARYMDFAREREESADSYLIGSILPVIAATPERRIYFEWGEGCIYPNLFSMLAGKPGDRKSSAINLAERVARLALKDRRFLPDCLSVEALFDEYDVKRGGWPDKLLIADDANPFLGLIQKSNYGERVGEQLLRLYDCKGLAEAFRRNKKAEKGRVRRHIPESSTNIVFGATFNICQFQGHEIRSGLQRRFTYYLAEDHGRFLVMPAKSNRKQLKDLSIRLKRTISLAETKCEFAPDAAVVWERFQRQNRANLRSTGIALESQLARLNGQPTHVIKLAIIFHLAMWLESDRAFTGVIEAPTLQKAIEHSEHCIASAQALDAIANRAAIEAEADILLANIQKDFPKNRQTGRIYLTRTDLTKAYAPHSGRNGWKPDDLYLRFIPDLIRRGKAKEIPRPGKPPAFEFKAEEDV